MSKPDAKLREWAREGLISSEELAFGLNELGVLPGKAAWRQTLHRFLLLAGAAFLLSGIFFFFAYNWDDLTRFARLGVVAAALIGAIVAAWHKGMDTLVGSTMLVAAAMLVGALLGVYGQEYQTGADAYSLFLTWTLLIAGWVFIARSKALWLIWITLVNITLGLVWKQTGLGQGVSDGWLQLALFAINLVSLLGWEKWGGDEPNTKSYRVGPRLLFVVALFLVSIPTAGFIIGEGGLETVTGFLAYGLFGVGAYWHYRFKRRDMVNLTALLFSGIVLVSIAVGNWIDIDEFTMLLVGMVVIGLAVLATRLLRQWAMEEEA